MNDLHIDNPVAKETPEDYEAFESAYERELLEDQYIEGLMALRELDADYLDRELMEDEDDEL